MDYWLILDQHGRIDRDAIESRGGESHAVTIHPTEDSAQRDLAELRDRFKEHDYHVERLTADEVRQKLAAVARQ